MDKSEGKKRTIRRYLAIVFAAAALGAELWTLFVGTLS
jgi:hypothetical protein